MSFVEIGAEKNVFFLWIINEHTHTHNLACSVKHYDVLKAKNALVKSVYHVTQNIFVQSCLHFVFVCML
jgi:hypothetical protein